MGDLIKPIAFTWRGDYEEVHYASEAPEGVKSCALYGPEAASRIAELEAKLAERDAEVADLTKALTGLTCGGSEFFTRKGERFVADIKACVEYVRRAKTDANRGRIGALHKSKAAEAKLATAVRALEFGRDIAELMPEQLRAVGHNVFADHLTDFVNRADQALASIQGET